MLKNILIISSNHTGHGHKSITESLIGEFEKQSDVNIHVIDGFALEKKVLLKIGKSYGPITRTSKRLWHLIWDITKNKPAETNKIIEMIIEKHLLSKLEETKPDLIISVHPNFNGSVINVLKKHNINVPFVTLIADLVSIHPLWADNRVDQIISPTEEAKEKCIGFGVDPSKIKVFGLPVRSQFVKYTTDQMRLCDPKKPLRFLILSGGEGVGNMSTIADHLVKNFNCNVKIIAGRNKHLTKTLQHKFLDEKYNNKVTVYSYVKNIQDLMLDSDIAIVRGSPNVMMESVCCNLPLIATGALPGQEVGNLYYLEKYKLGVVCKDLHKLDLTIKELIANNCEKLNEIKLAQKAHYSPDTVKDIVTFILQTYSENILQTQKVG